jgi:protein subunit release factor A
VISLLLVTALAQEPAQIQQVEDLMKKYQQLQTAKAVKHDDHHEVIIQVYKDEIEILKAKNAELEKELVDLKKSCSGKGK